MTSPAAGDGPVTLITLGRLGYEGPKNSAALPRLLSQPKRLGVLLYVLLSQRGGSVSREHVLSVFWPESDSAKARNALRQTLSFVRSCLGQDAILGVGAHGMAMAPSVICDAVRFEELLDDSRKEDALQLYRGEFLPGFHVSGSATFAEWLDARRQHLARRAAKAAWDLSAEREAGSDAHGAAFWGNRALALSPFSESEVQRLMRLHDRLGNFVGALRAFQGLKNSLESEFGVGPSEETARMADDIRNRLEFEGQRRLPTTRRLADDRRADDRRREQHEWDGPERRMAPDRRIGERRSGGDRRLMS